MQDYVTYHVESHRNAGLAFGARQKQKRRGLAVSPQFPALRFSGFAAFFLFSDPVHCANDSDIDS